MLASLGWGTLSLRAYSFLLQLWGEAEYLCLMSSFRHGDHHSEVCVLRTKCLC
jgi:hypothetical protein